tara:strand:+ start:817 stop:1041 length:225 start_codon:yes stop_codon:yes gene_type:complete
MTSVNVTELKNTVTVNEGDTTVVTVATAGPQGASSIIDVSDVVDNSVVYYNASSGTLKADQTTTKLTLVNGGNF